MAARGRLPVRGLRGKRNQGAWELGSFDINEGRDPRRGAGCSDPCDQDHTFSRKSSCEPQRPRRLVRPELRPSSGIVPWGRREPQRRCRGPLPAARAVCQPSGSAGSGTRSAGDNDAGGSRSGGSGAVAGNIWQSIAHCVPNVPKHLSLVQSGGVADEVARNEPKSVHVEDAEDFASERKCNVRRSRAR